MEVELKEGSGSVKNKVLKYYKTLYCNYVNVKLIIILANMGIVSVR